MEKKLQVFFPENVCLSREVILQLNESKKYFLDCFLDGFTGTLFRGKVKMRTKMF